MSILVPAWKALIVGLSERRKKGSGTFFLELGPSAWAHFQFALGERLDLQPKPFAAPGFLLVGGQAQRVCVHVGQSFVEQTLVSRVPFRVGGTKCGVSGMRFDPGIVEAVRVAAVA